MSADDTFPRHLNAAMKTLSAQPDSDKVEIEVAQLGVIWWDRMNERERNYRLGVADSANPAFSHGPTTTAGALCNARANPDTSQVPC